MKKMNRFKRKNNFTLTLWIRLSSLQVRKLNTIAKSKGFYGKKNVIKYLIDKA